MDYAKIDIEVIGSKADKWNEIKDNILCIDFPEIVPGPGDKFKNKNGLVVTFKETSDNKVFGYLSKWISDVTPLNEANTISKNRKIKKSRKFITIEDSINNVIIKFCDDQDNEIFSHSFSDVYPTSIITDTMGYTEGSVERMVMFHANLDQDDIVVNAS